MTFGLLYAFSENFVLPLSHDEVVHGKGSLLGKMPGDDWQQFANAARLSTASCGAIRARSCCSWARNSARPANGISTRRSPWWLLDHWPHQGVQALVRDLNRLYRDTPGAARARLRAGGLPLDRRRRRRRSRCSPCCAAAAQSDPPVAVVCNFTPVPRHDYRIGLPSPGRWREVLNTDAGVYGGSDWAISAASSPRRGPSHGFPASATLTLPPLATLYLVFTPPGADEADAADKGVRRC